MVNQIFVNLAVKDLDKTKEFWTKLGFSFNPQFTDKNAAALVLGENIFAMLLLPEFFKRFTKKELIDTSKAIETINAVSLNNRDEVDQMMKKAMDAGGKETRRAEDYGWMYDRSFEDIDGHQWEVAHMDMTKAPANPGESEQI